MVEVEPQKKSGMGAAIGDAMKATLLKKCAQEQYINTKANRDRNATIAMNMQSHIESANTNPSVRIQCKKHFSDAEYFSASLGKYICFNCLVEE
jgi:hypothetical protein